MPAVADRSNQADIASPARSGTRAHLVDVTMFWSRAGGGVGRYLRSKHAWVETDAPLWRHTLLVLALLLVLAA